jgi:hypothetical protein
MKLTIEQLLSLVEWLAGGAEEIPEKQTNADKLLLNIYRIIHSHRENACCKYVHEDWRKEAQETYKKIKDLGEI